MKIDVQDWSDSQRCESGFWKWQKQHDNIEQYHRNHYYIHGPLENSSTILSDFFKCKYINLNDSTIIDLGSGPHGILHCITAKQKIAVDPLMDDFRDMGYNISDNDVKVLSLSGENLNEVDITADIIFCLNCLDHVLDAYLVVDAIYNQLNNNGFLVLMVDMRNEDQLDCYHKIALTEAILDNLLSKFTIKEKSLVPHQTGNPLIQYLCVCQK